MIKGIMNYFLSMINNINYLITIHNHFWKEVTEWWYLTDPLFDRE